MKNPTRPALALLLGLLCAACGKRESADDRLPPPGEPRAMAEAAARPANLPGPDDLPPCPGLLSVEESSGDSRSGTALLASSQPPADLADFYAEHLASDGWVMTSSFQQGKDHHFQFRQGLRFLRLQIGPAAKPAAAHVRLAWGLPEGAPLAAESQAPDYGEEGSEPEPMSIEW
jgi:hypothetical protein